MRSFFNQQQFIRGLNAKLLLVLSVSLSSILFFSCKKEVLPASSATNSYPDLVSPIITVKNATTFFSEKFGDDQLARLQTIPTSLEGDTVMYIPSNISIKPKWSNAEIATLLKINPILVVPVEKIPELDSNKSGYSLVFYNDSTNHIQSVLECYVPTISYDKKVDGKYSAKDFTGFMYQITMDSKIKKVLKLKDGKFLGELLHNKSNSTGFRDIDPCYDGFGTKLLDKIGAFFSNIFNSIGNFFGDSSISSSDPSGGVNFTFGAVSSGYDGSFSSLGGGSSSIINLGNQNNLPNNIYDIPTLKSGLINFGISEDNYNYFIQQHKELENEILNFIVKRSMSRTNLQDIVNEYQFLDAATLAQHYNLLNVNDNYYNDSKIAGFPTLGGSDWQSKVAFPELEVLDKVVDYNIECIILKNQCPSCSSFSIQFKAFRNVLSGTVHTMLDLAGLVPGFGEVFDFANGVFYTIEGDGVNAAFSFAATLPFAGWAATGAKYAVKTIGESGRIYNLSFRLIDNSVKFADVNALRSQLRNVLKLSVGDGKLAHHIIPLKFIDNPIFQAASKSRFGFHPNEFRNGIALSEAVHTGSHSIYSDKVETALDQINKNFNGNITPEVAHSEIQKLITRIRKEIADNPNVNIDYLNF